MRVLHLALIFQVHAQLQCDKSTIHTTVGKEMNVFCRYDAKSFLYSKKYWCLGEIRSTCEVLMDTDGFTTARLRKRAGIYETRSRTFNIIMKGLQLEDTGIYWAAIDKIYADLMFRINVVVTEESVSRPQVRLEGLPMVTCQGQPVLLQCQTERGTNVKYSWSREARPQDVFLQSSADLHFRCDSLTEDARYTCLAQNAVSREQSKPVSIHLLQAGQENCIYLLTSDELESYDCRTTTASPTTSISTFLEVSTSGGKQSTNNQTQSCKENACHRSWSGVPLWYDIVRWVCFVAMVTVFVLLCSCRKTSRVAC
ncbi:hypothetical protein C0J45_14426 [Silurus meridionalis]|nr:hypothetical protein C0J45_14426 [Silurus meridionalis]